MQRVLKRVFVAAFAMSLGSLEVVLLSISAQAQEITYQIVDLGRDTHAKAINASGEATGWSLNASEGFLREPDGTTTTFVLQNGCRDVLPWAINDSGLIVGSANIGTNCSNIVGFLRAKDGTITIISGLDGWEYVDPLSIDAKGGVVGLFADSTGRHAFVRSPEGTLTEFAPLGDVEMIDITSSSNGTIAGSYYDAASGQDRGFLQNIDGTLTTFRDPEHTHSFFQVAVNNKGWITGWNSAGYPGFIRSPSGKIISLDRASPDSINSSETVSGFKNKLAFVRSKKGKITKVHMPADDDFVEWAVINDNGVLAGSFCQRNDCNYQIDHGFLAYPSQ